MRDDVQAVEEVLAEAPALHLLRQVAVGGGDDPDIDLDAGGTPDPLEGLLLQHAHDLALGLQRHVGDLVEQQRAAMGLLQRAHLGRAVGAVAQALAAEELDLQPVGAHGRAIDHDEGPAGALGEQMQQPRGDFLAAAGAGRRSAPGCPWAPRARSAGAT